MRVTKLIREYVEDTINKALPIEEKEIAPELYEMRKKISDASDEIIEATKVFMANMIAAKRAELDIPDDWTFEVNNDYFRSNIHEYSGDSQLMRDYRKASSERKAHRENAIKEVLLSLEFGASRDELNDMIAKAVSEA